MTIDITLDENKNITANSKVISKVSENRATLLKFHVGNFVEEYGFNFYLDFKKPNGSKFTTQKLNVVNNLVEYEITNSLLDESGFLQVEVVLIKDNKKVIYPTLWFEINESINATDELAPENKTLISEIEKVLDKIDTSGTGTKFLSDDGTYKNISSGTSDYDDLENQPIKRITSMDNENPVILRNLESGAYLLHGWFSPFTGSTVKMAAQTPIIATVATTSDISYIQLFFPFNNIIQYFEIKDDDFTSKNVSLNDLLSRIEALEGGS